MTMKQDIDHAIKRELDLTDEMKGDTVISDNHGTGFHGASEDMKTYFMVMMRICVVM